MSHMQTCHKMSLKGKTSRDIYDSKKNDPGVHLPRAGAIYMYRTIITFIGIYPRSQVSV